MEVGNARCTLCISRTDCEVVAIGLIWFGETRYPVNFTSQVVTQVRHHNLRVHQSWKGNRNGKCIRCFCAMNVGEATTIRLVDCNQDFDGFTAFIQPLQIRRAKD